MKLPNYNQIIKGTMFAGTAVVIGLLTLALCVAALKVLIIALRWAI